MTTWTCSSKSFFLYFYFNGASRSPFAACSVNNNGFEEEAVKTQNSHHFSNDFKVTFSLPLSSLWLKLCNFKCLSPHDRFPQHKFSALPKANSSVFYTSSFKIAVYRFPKVGNWLQIWYQTEQWSRMDWRHKLLSTDVNLVLNPCSTWSLLLGSNHRLSSPLSKHEDKWRRFKKIFRTSAGNN